MMKRALFIFIFVASKNLAQTRASCNLAENDSLRNNLSQHIQLPLSSTFCCDADFVFITWKQQPMAVKFTLYDRWGNAILCVDDLKSIHFEHKELAEKLTEENIYFYFVEFISAQGISTTFCGHVMYRGYCRCG